MLIQAEIAQKKMELFTYLNGRFKYVIELTG